MIRSGAILVLFLLNSFLTIFAGDNQKPIIEKFAHEVEKIKPHPEAEFETLKNGFRYVLLPNKTPEKRVMVYLYVSTGSLNETDSQQGLAHFLEHMAFNGTKDFPSDSLIDFFKKMGMSFGGDTNAHTSFDETVYKLNLPEEKYRDQAIMIMADYAMHMTLAPEEIEKERGIILSEKRARDSIDYRIFVKELQFSLPNVLVANRLPIGTDECIKNVKREEFLDYYNTWYRPEKMVLVVVGDIKTDDWHKTIKKAFKNAKAKAPIRSEFQLTDPNHKGLKIHYTYEKESPDTNLGIGTVVVKKQPELKYKDKRKIQLAESAAIYVLNERFREKLAQKGTPFVSASFSVSSWLEEINSGSVDATCKPENWKATLISIENELRKALEFGFSDQELELFKKDYINRLDVAVNGIATTNSNSFMGQILYSVSRKTPFLSAVQNREIDKPIVEALTKEEALKEFKKYWAPDHRLITVSGNVEIKEPEEEIKKALNEASLTELKKHTDEVIVEFPFEKKPENSAQINGKEEFKELGFTRYTFANNVVLNFKPTTFKANEVSFNVGFGHGSLSAPANKPGIVHLAALAMSEGGLTKLSKVELSKALTGKNAGAGFSVGSNCFLLQSTTTPADFELSLQLCRARILYSGFREEATEVIKKFVDQRYNSLDANIQDYFRNSLMRLVSKNDYTMALPDRKSMEAITLEDIKEWLTTQFLNCSIEINVVGNIEEKKVLELVSTYFGSLPERKKIAPPNRKAMAIKEKFDVNDDFKTSINKALVFQMIPTTDYRNIEEVRRLNMLGKILSERTRKLVREKLSISYSPFAGHSFNKDFKNSCYFQFMADVEPQKIEDYKNATDEIIKDILTNGISEEEFNDVLKPTMTEIKTYIKTNGYWLDRVLSDSTSEPESLKISETFISSYEEMKAQHINDVAKKYLSVEKKSTYVLKAIPPEQPKSNVDPKPVKTDEAK